MPPNNPIFAAEQYYFFQGHFDIKKFLKLYVTYDLSHLMENCLFCSIANGTLESKIIIKEKNWISFWDANPVAPFHALIIPNRHYNSLNELEDPELYSELIQGVKKTAQKENLENGYRIVINTGTDGGQTVSHLHIHLLGKRKMGWPPG